jgi:hypothetical protein
VIERDGTSSIDLQENQITLAEDGIEQELLGFEALSPGIQLVIALNISDPFAIQDINGVSRFDYIKEALINWAAQPLSSSPDRVSLVSNDGLEYSHLDDKDQFISVLEEYDPDLRETESNFNVLSQAIGLASDPVTEQGMKRVVLLFTSQPTTDSFEAIDNLAAQASDQQVMIYSILVSSPAFFTTAGATRLQAISSETGGQFIPFSGEEPLADLGLTLEPLRNTYQLLYRSLIVTPGIHTLDVRVTSNIGETRGTREFFLDIQPPNPIFISPPRSITREIVNEDETSTPPEYQPQSVPLNVLLEFPDQHPRDLVELIFRVDGEIVERRTEPPYDLFIWDLSTYTSSSTHFLSLEAVDVMGLSRISVETPVEVEVIVPPPSLGIILRENGPAIAGLAVILLAGLTLFLLVARGRIQPSPEGTFRSFISRISQLFRSKSLIKRILPARKTNRKSPPDHDRHSFRLLPISDISQQLFPSPIRVNNDQAIFGSADQSDIIRVNHPSVIKKHAEISSLPDGRFQITDHGSAAGTWINYQQITSSAPQFLKDGDIIQFGEAVFRFQIMEPLESKLDSKEN